MEPVGPCQVREAKDESEADVRRESASGTEVTGTRETAAKVMDEETEPSAEHQGSESQEKAHDDTQFGRDSALVVIKKDRLTLWKSNMNVMCAKKFTRRVQNFVDTNEHTPEKNRLSVPIVRRNSPRVEIWIDIYGRILERDLLSVLSLGVTSHSAGVTIWMDLMHHWQPCFRTVSAILIVLSTVVAKDAISSFHVQSDPSTDSLSSISLLGWLKTCPEDLAKYARAFLLMAARWASFLFYLLG